LSGRCIPSDLTLFESPTLPRRPASTAALEEFVMAQDVFYVGGGNTANLLAIWRTHGLDTLLRRAWRAGAVLSGISAGMLCWFQGGVTDSFGGYLPFNDGLGLIKARACPHYDGEAKRQAIFRKLIASEGGVGYAADDGAALHFVGTQLHEVVTSRKSAGAYRLSAKRGKVMTTALPTRFLGR